MPELPPAWPLTSSPVAAQKHGSNGSFISLYRHDSPQSTLHDSHKSQQSPTLPTTPPFDLRRQRRKPSPPDLAARPLDHWSPSAIMTRQAHSPSQHADLPPHFPPPPSPPLPVTPGLGPSTTSPSLISTVTTLQSTPERTPNFRARARPERDWAERPAAGGQPTRTKRKFDSLRHAKRLPRQRSGIGGSLRGQEELWEVYAAVFDPPRAPEVFAVVSSTTKQADTHANHDKENAPHARSSYPQELNDRTWSNLSAASQHVRQRDRLPTSSISLSKFDFPQPPGRDNWAAHLAEQSHSSSPATILYRGASFDVVNPHASLILGAHDIETPAEIDGLLDDYFDRQEDKMKYDTVTGEPSQSSLRIPSEGSRRILYDDPGSARRNILRVEEGLPSPPSNAMLNDLRSPRSQKMSAAAWQMALAAGSHRSDPFDLTLSESGSNNQLKAIDEVLRKGHNAEVAPASPAEVRGLGITIPDHGADTQATLGPSVDPTIGEILNGYDYTRVPCSSPEKVDVTDSSAIERARKVSIEAAYDTSRGLISPLQTPGAERKDLAQDLDHDSKAAGPTVIPALPTPPAPVYTRGGLHHYLDCSELPTSDQTYGETNQLLHITPEPAPQYPPYSPGTPCNAQTCDSPEPIHIHQDSVSATPATSYPLPWFHDNKENIPPSDELLAELAAAAERFHFFGDRDDDEDTSKHLQRSSSFYPDDGGDISKQLQRSSSFYPDDVEDDWETQYTESHHDLTRNYGRISLDSYADASVRRGGSQGDKFLSPIIDLTPATSTPNVVAADEELEHRRRIKKTIKELEAKIVDDNLNVHYGTAKVDKAKRKADFVELDRLRGLYLSPSDQFTLKASESLSSLKTKSAHTLQKANPFRPRHNPRDSFSRIAALGMSKPNLDAASDHRVLLDPPTPPTLGGDLQWNDTHGTFTTLRGDFTIGNNSPVSYRGAATELWSPFIQDPTVKAIYGGSQSNIATMTKGKAAEVELRPLGGKSKRYKPAALSNQYEPRELHLIKSKRLSDAQFVARQPAWRMRPRVAANSPLGKHNDWSFAANETMLGKPETDLEKALRADQDAVSTRYLWVCAALPPLTLAFGLGAFDSAIKRKVGDGIPGASPRVKRNALLVSFPLGCIFWAILVIALYLMVLSSQGMLFDEKKGNGGPFSSNGNRM